MPALQAQIWKGTTFCIDRLPGKTPGTVIFRFTGPFTARDMYGSEVDRDVVVRFPDQKAWILQSPLDVRYDKMSLGRCGCAFKMDKHGDGDLVRRAEQCEDPVTWMVESPEGAMAPV
jgi:hypothetical protein